MSDEVKLLPCAFCGGEAFGAMDKCRVQCRACGALGPFNYDKTKAIELWQSRPPIGTDEIVERLRDLSFALAAGGSEETDPAKLLDRIEWGVGNIQQVEAKRTADLIEELSKTPRTTWGEVKKAVLARAFADPADPAIAAMKDAASDGGVVHEKGFGPGDGESHIIGSAHD